MIRFTHLAMLNGGGGGIGSASLCKEGLNMPAKLQQPGEPPDNVTVGSAAASPINTTNEL